MLSFHFLSSLDYTCLCRKVDSCLRLQVHKQKTVKNFDLVPQNSFYCWLQIVIFVNTRCERIILYKVCLPCQRFDIISLVPIDGYWCFSSRRASAITVVTAYQAHLAKMIGSCGILFLCCNNSQTAPLLFEVFTLFIYFITILTATEIHTKRKSDRSMTSHDRTKKATSKLIWM